jgi:hypothetical protein
LICELSWAGGSYHAADSAAAAAAVQVESLHVLYHLTGNSTYQEWGWQIFQAFERHSRVPR